VAEAIVKCGKPVAIQVPISRFDDEVMEVE
jgi:hypothetical protein